MKNQRYLPAFLAVIAVLALVATFGCSPPNPPPTYTAYGTVRSTWLHSHYSDSHSVVSFEADDGQLIKIKFASIEPRLWVGMRAKISYQRDVDYIDGGSYGQCRVDNEYLYKLTAVVRLDR